jgi:RNA polymerase sigma factor (sigma-70 family)
LTDKELISRLKQREEAAFRVLVDQYRQRVYNTALGLLQHELDAEDAAQDVFVQIYRSIEKFREESLLSTWIYRITVSRCLDILRNRKRKKRWGVLLQLFNQQGELNVDPPNFYHPGVQLDQKENAALLFKLIKQLPEKQQTAFILFKLEGLSYAEIADIMKTTEKAVDALLQRAKINLKKNALIQ